MENNNLIILKNIYKIYIRLLLYLKEKLLSKLKTLNTSNNPELNSLNSNLININQYAESNSNAFDHFIVQGIFEKICSKSDDNDCSNYKELLKSTIPSEIKNNLESFKKNVLEKINQLNLQVNNSSKINQLKSKLDKLVKKQDLTEFEKIVTDLTNILDGTTSDDISKLRDAGNKSKKFFFLKRKNEKIKQEMQKKLSNAKEKADSKKKEATEAKEKAEKIKLQEKELTDEAELKKKSN